MIARGALADLVAALIVKIRTSPHWDPKDEDAIRDQFRQFSFCQQFDPRTDYFTQILFRIAVIFNRYIPRDDPAEFPLKAALSEAYAWPPARKFRDKLPKGPYRGSEEGCKDLDEFLDASEHVLCQVDPGARVSSEDVPDFTEMVQGIRDIETARDYVFRAFNLLKTSVAVEREYVQKLAECQQAVAGVESIWNEMKALLETQSTDDAE